MANPTKVLANIGAASAISDGGNRGYEGVYLHYEWSEAATVTALPVARTNFMLGVARVPCHIVGLAAGLSNPPTSGQVNFVPVKIPCDGTGTPVALASTIAVITSAAAGPAITSTIKANGTTNTTHSSTTGITDFVLGTTTFNQGDAIAITTTGTFTSASGLFVDIWLAEDNGAY